MDEAASGDTGSFIEQKEQPLAALVGVKGLAVQPGDAAPAMPADDPMLALEHREEWLPGSSPTPAGAMLPRRVLGLRRCRVWPPPAVGLYPFNEPHLLC